MLGPFTGVVETAARIRTGGVPAREVTAAALARITRLDPALRAFVTVAGEEAVAEADRLDARRRRGAPLGSLHGVPVGVKDTIETAGLRTTHGSPLFDEHGPAEDRLRAARLRAAGAIVIGKTNTPEFAIGPFTMSRRGGLTRNPHDAGRTPGGSSGGSAAAVAAGPCAAAVGRDLGGSLRVPASFCGIVAGRSAPGRVLQHPELAAWDTLTVNGPMARTVRDAAEMLAAMAGPDPRDPTAVAEPGTTLRLPPEPAPARGLRVAWSADLGEVPVQASVRAAAQALEAELALDLAPPAPVGRQG